MQRVDSEQKRMKYCSTTNTADTNWNENEVTFQKASLSFCWNVIQAGKSDICVRMSNRKLDKSMHPPNIRRKSLFVRIKQFEFMWQ